MNHHLADHFFMFYIDTAIRPVCQSPGAQHHWGPPLAQFYITVRFLQTGNNDKSVHLLVLTKLYGLQLFVRLIVATAHHCAIAIFVAHILDSSDSLCPNLVPQSVHYHTNQVALLRPERPGHIVGHIACLLNDLLDTAAGLIRHIAVAAIQIPGNRGLGYSYLPSNI